MQRWALACGVAGVVACMHVDSLSAQGAVSSVVPDSVAPVAHVHQNLWVSGGIGSGGIGGNGIAGVVSG